MKLPKLILPLLILTGSYFSTAVPSLAQSALGLTAIPPRLEIEADPGQTISQEIKVRNESDTDRIITTSIKDFIVTDNKGTPLSLEELDDPGNRWAASSWIQVSPTQLLLKPGETKALILTAIIPADALPGGHYAMVLHTPSNEAVITDNGSTIETNVGTLVYITVAGDIKQDARVKEFSTGKFFEYGPIDFKTIVTNLSDVHINPQGSINIKNWFGGNTATLELPSQNIFPYTNRNYLSTLDRKWLFGRYQANLNAAYGSSGQALTATVFFWVIPWRLIILAITVIAILISLILLSRRHTSASSSHQLETLEKELEDLKKKYRDRK